MNRIKSIACQIVHVTSQCRESLTGNARLILALVRLALAALLCALLTTLLLALLGLRLRRLESCLFLHRRVVDFSDLGPRRELLHHLHATR